MQGNRKDLYWRPTEKATERLSLILCGHVGLCHNETVLTLAFHRRDLSSVHSIQCCFRSSEFHFPSQFLGRTRREPAFPRVHLCDLPLGGGWEVSNHWESPWGGTSPVAWSWLCVLPVLSPAADLPHCLGTCCCSCLSNHCSYGWMKRLKREHQVNAGSEKQ